VPAIAETLPGFEALSFYGIGVPAGVPKPVMAKLNTQIAHIITAPETREQLRQQARTRSAIRRPSSRSSSATR